MIERKTTGFLLDELITAQFKYKANPTLEAEKRLDQLFMFETGIEPFLAGEIRYLVEKLQQVSKACWDAQEVVMRVELTDPQSVRIVAEAAKKAQAMNAKRNKLIREIDKICGEQDTVLPKTYGE